MSKELLLKELLENETNKYKKVKVQTVLEKLKKRNKVKVSWFEQVMKKEMDRAK